MSDDHAPYNDPPPGSLSPEPTHADAVLALILFAAFGAGVYLVGIGIAYLAEAARLWLHG